jgi:hypothetical protein
MDAEIWWGPSYKVITCQPRNEVVENSQVNLREIGFEDEKWMYLAQGCVQSWAIALVVLNL